MDLVAICLVFFFSSLFPLFQSYCQQEFFLDAVTQKKERRRLVTNPLLAFCVLVSFLFVPFSSLFAYDLPPFFATFVFVFLLADASPFLLDFFLVANISRSFYVNTIINDFPFLFIWSTGFFIFWRASLVLIYVCRQTYSFHGICLVVTWSSNVRQ